MIRFGFFPFHQRANWFQRVCTKEEIPKWCFKVWVSCKQWWQFSCWANESLKRVALGGENVMSNVLSDFDWKECCRCFKFKFNEHLASRVVRVGNLLSLLFRGLTVISPLIFNWFIHYWGITWPRWQKSWYLKEQCHEDFVVLGQFCA